MLQRESFDDIGFENSFVGADSIPRYGNRGYIFVLGGVSARDNFFKKLGRKYATDDVIGTMSGGRGKEDASDEN